MRILRISFVVLSVLVCLGTNVIAVTNYRLRANVNPPCESSQGSLLKFADIYADGNIAVMGSYGCRGVFIFDISNPDAPTLASWYNPAPNQSFLEAIVIGNRGYFGSGGTSPSGGSGGDGVHIVDLTNPASPVLLGKVTPATGGFSNIHEMMVFDQGNARYLLENSNSTSTTMLRIIDVTNPAAPVLKWEFSAVNNGWIHAMHIRGTRLYLSAFFSNPRVEIFDISNLNIQTPTALGAVNVGFSANHSAWTSEDGNILYSAREISNSDAANPGDIRVYDVSNPANAVMVNRFSMADLGITAVTPHNPVVMGNKLYVAWYQAGTQVFDISSPSKPARVGQYDTWAANFTESDLAEVRKAKAKFAPDETVCGLNLLTGQQITGYNGNWAVFPFLGEDKVLLGDLATGLYVIDVRTKNPISDFDGDGKTDYSMWSSSTGNWTLERSSDSGQVSVNWGLPNDIPVAGDYDGDGKIDQAIFRPSTGTWWIIKSSDGSRPAIHFGMQGDVPVTGDYDGDGKTDLTVFRPSNGVWYIAKSSGGISYINWGLAEDKPLPVNYDGDSKTDVAVWRPSTGVWYVIKSSDGGVVYTGFGLNDDKPLVTDVDGDRRTEFTIFRPSTGGWHILNPANDVYFGYHFGISSDIPVPADYDGDGKTDVAVFRPDTNDWYRHNSSTGALVIRNFGSNGDTPSPSSVQPQ